MLVIDLEATHLVDLQVILLIQEVRVGLLVIHLARVGVDLTPLGTGRTPVLPPLTVDRQKTATIEDGTVPTLLMIDITEGVIDLTLPRTVTTAGGTVPTHLMMDTIEGGTVLIHLMNDTIEGGIVPTHLTIDTTEGGTVPTHLMIDTIEDMTGPMIQLTVEVIVTALLLEVLHHLGQGKVLGGASHVV